MNTDTLNTDVMRRYLLDGLSEDERQAMEERFMSDDAAFDEMLAVEDELYYEYEQGELDARERRVFEQKFLSRREDREKAAFAAAFLDAAEELSPEQQMAVLQPVEDKPGFFQSIAAFFNFGSALQFGMAAAVLLLLLGITGLLVQNSRIQNEMAAVRQQNEEERRRLEAEIANKQQEQQQIEDQLAAERERSGTSESRVRELESQREKLEKEIEEARRADRAPDSGTRSSQPTIASLIISPGLFTRSDGRPMNRIEIAPNARRLALGLRLKNVDEFPAYTVKISDVDSGGEVFSRSNLKPRGRGAAKRLGISIRSASLRTGDYEVELSGVKPNGESEEITRYYFSVIK